MHSDDGTRIWPPLPLEDDEESGVSLLHEKESNIVSVGKEFFVYAFFDSLEREDLDSDEAMFDYKGRNNFTFGAEELLSARFDCVFAPYFNDNIGGLREFYAKVRGEDLDGEEQDLTKEYWHGDERTGQHTELLEKFFGDKSAFRILFYVAYHNDAAAEFLENVFQNERWIGLGLSPYHLFAPPTATLFKYDHVEYDEPELYQLSSVWELTQRRINSLRHVFSLDFASDAVMPPPVPDEPEPVKLSIGQRIAQQQRKKKKEQERPPFQVALKSRRLKKDLGKRSFRGIKLRTQTPILRLSAQQFLQRQLTVF